MNTDKTYWLLEEDDRKVAAEMRRRIENYAERMETSGRWDVWCRMSRLYFSRDSDSGLRATRVSEGGAQGEYIGTRDNYLGRLVRQVYTLITSQRPSFTSRSIADGSESIQQVNVSDKLCDHMVSKRNAEAAVKRADLYMLIFGMGWVAATWDERTGRHLGTEVSVEGAEPMMVPKGTKIPEGAQTRQRYEGDIRFSAKRPDEVVYDVDLDETCEHEWLIVAKQVSRWKLAAQHPELADHITSADTFTRLDKLRLDLRLDGTQKRQTNNDMVTVYELFAPPSAVLPEGRYCMMLGDRLVADDRALYDDFAHYEMTAEYEPGTKNGHSYLWDLCGLQQCSDSANVAMTTMVENTGKLVLFIPEGSDLDTSKEAMMMPYHVVRGSVAPAFLSAGSQALEPLMLTKNAYQDSMTQIAGANDTVMGNSAGTASGEALKTMSALAQQSVSTSQEAYARCSSEAVFGGLKRYRTFASEELIARICGSGRVGDVKAFKESLANIEGIDAEMGPAELRFSAGKRAFADKMWESGAITTPEAYLEAQATGKVTPLLERPQSQRKLIEAENERLRQGLPCFVSDTDDHRLHIQQHACVGDDVNLRGPMIDPATKQPVMEPQVGPDGLPVLDPMTGQPALAPKLNPVLMNLTAHEMEHVRALREMDPDLASALSTEPVPGKVLEQQAGIQAQANAMQQQNAEQPAPPNEIPAPGEGENINPAGMPA